MTFATIATSSLGQLTRQKYREEVRGIFSVAALAVKRLSSEGIRRGEVAGGFPSTRPVWAVAEDMVRRTAYNYSPVETTSVFAKVTSENEDPVWLAIAEAMERTTFSRDFTCDRDASVAHTITSAGQQLLVAIKRLQEAARYTVLQNEFEARLKENELVAKSVVVFEVDQEHPPSSFDSTLILSERFDFKKEAEEFLVFAGRVVADLSDLTLS